jgi:hypothetical protein
MHLGLSTINMIIGGVGCSPHVSSSSSFEWNQFTSVAVKAMPDKTDNHTRRSSSTQWYEESSEKKSLGKSYCLCTFTSNQHSPITGPTILSSLRFLISMLCYAIPNYVASACMRLCSPTSQHLQSQQQQKQVRTTSRHIRTCLL